MGSGDWRNEFERGLLNVMHTGCTISSSTLYCITEFDESVLLTVAYVLTRNDFTRCMRVCSERVAFFKQLRGGIEFVKELPRHPSGKLLRRKLTG